MAHRDDIIENIAAHELGVKLGYELGEGGSFGHCFTIEGDETKVVKVTQSLSEAIYALRLFDSPHPNVVDVYKVVQLEFDLRNTPHFLIYQERVDQDHPWMDVANAALDTLDYGFLDIYHPYDIDDYNAEVRDELINNPEYVQAIQQIQDGMWHHETRGNMAMDVKTLNMGVKLVEGEPQLALFDQMNLQLETHLERALNNNRAHRFQMHDHVPERLLHGLVVVKEFAVTERMEQEQKVIQQLSDEDSLLASFATPPAHEPTPEKDNNVEDDTLSTDVTRFSPK